MAKVCGWMGTILRVDLTTGMIAKQPFTEELRNDFIGGYGIGSKILYDETGPDTDPLAPDNRLIISTGPLTGTLALGSSRISVVFKSPLTDIIGYSSGGGHFAPELKYAGYDVIVVQGKAQEPVYLWIEDDRVEIRDAKHLWGKTVSETHKLLQQEHGVDIHSIGIGPGGENLVKFACLASDDLRTPGGCGSGCVMGSKNLKAIAVRGTKTVHIADPDRVFKIEQNALASIKTRASYSTFHQYGTTMLMAATGACGSLPVRNYEYSSESPTYGQEQWNRLTHHYIIENYPHKWVSCFGCPLCCGAWVDLDERFGEYACKSWRPEGGTLMCGALVEVSSYAAIVSWNELCDQYSLGTFEAASAISAAMEWYEKGIITKEDTDGLEIRFGNAEVIIELTHKIAKREGFGNILAEGVVKAGKIVGAPMETIPHSKGRCGDAAQTAGSPVRHLGYAVAPRGWDHLSGVDYSAALFHVYPVSRWLNIYKTLGLPDKYSEYHPERAVPTIIFENEVKMTDLVGTCKSHGIQWVSLDRDEGDMPYLASVLSAVTGFDFDAEQLIRITERFINLQKAYNVRLGLGRKDDQVHVRFQTPRSGPAKESKYNQEGFDKMLSRYYELHGWDPETGIPRRDTLEEMGLKYVADDLEEGGVQLGKRGHKYDMNDISLELRGIKSSKPV